jgi:hypothetical protein
MLSGFSATPIPHAFRFFRHADSDASCDIAGLIFGQVRQGQDKVGQTPGGDAVEEVALVLGVIAAAAQAGAVFGMDDLGVVAGGEIPDAEFFFHQVPDEHEFQKRVAVHARIRRPAPAVFLAEPLDDQLIKRVGDIHKIMRQIELPTHIRRIRTTAAAFVGSTSDRDPHGYAQNIPAGLTQQMRRDRTVHTAAHHHHNLPRWIIFRLPRSSI